jgi:hypothetical protein
MDDRRRRAEYVNHDRDRPGEIDALNSRREQGDLDAGHELERSRRR